MTSSSSRSSFVRVFRYAFVWVLLFIAVVAGAANKTWTNSFGGNWGDTFVWSDSVGALAGDTLNFPNVGSNSGSIFSNNNLIGDTSFGPINITSTSTLDSYSFGGNRILLNNDILSGSSTRTHSWGIPLRLASPVTFQLAGTLSGGVDLNGNDLTLMTTPVSGLFTQDPIIGAGAVIIDGSASSNAVEYGQVAMTYTGGTQIVNNGSLEISLLTEIGDVDVQSGRFTGHTDAMITIGALTVGPGGTVSPGADDGFNDGGMRTASLSLAGTYEAQVGVVAVLAALRRSPPQTTDAVAQGFISGSDNINVTGSVTLSGTLDLRVGSVGTPSSFQIITNDGTDPVVGEFVGFPNGQTVESNGLLANVNYNGGDGNDVVVTFTGRVLHYLENDGNVWGCTCNWVERTTPQSGDRLVFDTLPIGSLAADTNNNIGPLNLESLVFTVPGSITGNSIGLTNGIDAGSHAVTLDTAVTLNASQTFQMTGSVNATPSMGPPTFSGGGSVDLGSNNLNLIADSGAIIIDGPLSGTGTLFVDGVGGGLVTINNFQSAFFGATTVIGNGDLYLNGELPGTLSTTSPAARLNGNGTIQGATDILSGTISPGTGAGVAGNLTVGLLAVPSALNIAGNYSAELLGITTHDRIGVNGTVALSGTLTTSLLFVAPNGASFTIIDNDGTDPVSGTFSGLPEGAVFTVGGVPQALRISYIGGDGNDVVLIRVSSPAIFNLTPSNGPAAGGTMVTMTGFDFLPGATVTIAGVSVVGLTVVDPSTITFTTPPGPSGPATVFLMNPDGQSALSPVPFTYDSPSIANVNPSSGPVGTLVTISGLNFSGGVTSVTFNGVAASFTVDSDSQITATVPAGATTGPVVVSAGGFSSNAVTFTVACSDPPPTITASGPTDFCPPGSVTLTANTPTTPTVSSYLWSTGETTQSITVSTTGSYTVTVTYSNGCPATSAPQAVNVKAQPTVAISGPTSSCAGSTATLTASGSNISTFLWSPGGETTPSITVPVNAGSSSTYSVIVTSADGCVESASHTISPVSPQAINIDVPPSVTSGGTATASAQGTFTGPFTWTVLNGTILSGQGSSSIQFQAGTSGGVTIFVSSPDGACSADGSAVVQIIACSTSGPALNAPANNSTLTSPVTFSWSPVDGATSYEVYVAQGTSAPGLLGTTAGTSLSATVSSGPANWFVLARLAQSCSPNTTQSETRSFTATPATNCPTAGPVAISPSEGSRVFSPATFTWSSVSGVSGYRVLFSTNGGAFEDLGGILSPATTSIVAPVPPGDAVWYVEAIYSGCPAVASSAITFVVDPEDCSKHTSPSLLAPPSGSTVASSSVTFRWSSVEGADGYRVWNSVDGGDFETIGETPETMFTATIEPGAIQWFVEALFEGCESTFSPTQPFTVPLGANCAANQAPQLISPAAGQVTTAATVTFSWSSVGALEYELYLSVNSGTPTLVTKTPGTSFTTEVPEGDLEFFVRARFNGCPATTSGSRQFRYQPPANCGTELPVAISPQADTTGIPSPVTFRWSAVAGTTNYILTIASSSGVETIPTTSTQLTRPVSSGAGSWTVEAVFGAGCANTKSAASEFFVVVTPSGCTELAQPLIAAPSQISDRVSYFVQWQPVVGATSYQLQRSVGGSFENVVPLNLTETQASFTDTNEGTAPLTVLYRVRALSTTCTPLGVSAYSSVVGVTILPAVQTSNTTEGSTLRAQSETINYSIQLGPEFAGAAFSAMPTVPWLSVTPSSGTVPAAGINLQVTANTDDLPIGSSAGNVIVTLVTPDEVRTGGGLRQRASGTTSKTVPVNVNLVTPVTPNPKSGPPPDALIIPAVAHADGVNAQFQSDVRVTNTSPQVIKYQLTFTPTGAAGIAAGRQATIDIEPGRTVALDDVLKTWFGTGTTSALGTLEIRPLTKTAASTSSAAVKGLPNFVTFAASRTFSQTANGTFGQFIPAVPFANFLGRSSDPARPAVMSLQQIAQSAAFRTNLGLVEGSGQPATVNVSVFGDTGQKLTDFDVNLTGGQHMQLGSVLAQRGIQVNDGRLEVRVTSPGGKVTAYASVLDNRTNDSLLVTPVSLNEVGNTKFVLPGVAELSGGIPWQTDARLFNASDVAVNAQLTLQPLIGTEALTANVTLAPREVRQFDRILSTLFGVTNDGGALHIATTANANLIATARTYRPDGTGGSFGQFITAVTPNEAVAVGNRPLQILQVEESVRYRSNIGLAEVTGQAAMVEVTAIPPDSKFSITIRVPMDGNQFRQLNSLLRQMGLSDTHNARVSVRVVGGQGRVTAYASVIDNVTADPTFVPAQ